MELWPTGRQHYLDLFGISGETSEIHPPCVNRVLTHHPTHRIQAILLVLFHVPEICSKKFRTGFWFGWFATHGQLCCDLVSSRLVLVYFARNQSSARKMRTKQSKDAPSVPLIFQLCAS